MLKDSQCIINQPEQEGNEMKHKKEEVKNKDLMKSIKDAHKEKEGKNKPKKKGGKVKKVMEEFKAGKLHSGSKKGPEVTNPKQAIAIGLSEARKKGEKVSPKKKSHKKK